MMTLQGYNHPSDNEMQQWPQPLQTAYKEQTDIGWEQVLYGRIAKSWRRVATLKEMDQGDNSPDSWIRKIIRLNWKFGIDIWSFRNELVHGTDGPALKTEGIHTTELIRDIYQYIKPQVERGREALFPSGKYHLEHQSYQSQLAWLAQVRFLYPDEYTDTEKITIGRLSLEREFNHEKARLTGDSGH